MIISIMVQRCPNCKSDDIVRNGHDYKGSQKYQYYTCASYGTLNASQGYTEEEKDLILRALWDFAWEGHIWGYSG